MLIANKIYSVRASFSIYTSNIENLENYKGYYFLKNQDLLLHELFSKTSYKVDIVSKSYPDFTISNNDNVLNMILSFNLTNENEFDLNKKIHSLSVVGKIILANSLENNIELEGVIKEAYLYAIDGSLSLDENLDRRIPILEVVTQLPELKVVFQKRLPKSLEELLKTNTNSI